jgi:hypothetical protein
MKTIVFVNFFIFLVVCGIVLYRGLDFKKRSSWWHGLYAFISGFMLSFLISDDNGGNHVVTVLTQGFLAGTAFLVMLMGSVITQRQRNQAEKYLAHSEEDYQETLDNLAKSLFKDKAKKEDKTKTKLS